MRAWIKTGQATLTDVVFDYVVKVVGDEFPRHNTMLKIRHGTNQIQI